MADDKKKKDYRDDSKIDGNDPNEVAYAARQCGCTSADIKRAIATVGNSRAKVYEWIRRNV